MILLLNLNSDSVGLRVMFVCHVIFSLHFNWTRVSSNTRNLSLFECGWVGSDHFVRTIGNIYWISVPENQFTEPSKMKYQSYWHHRITASRCCSSTKWQRWCFQLCLSVCLWGVSTIQITNCTPSPVKGLTLTHPEQGLSPSPPRQTSSNFFFLLYFLNFRQVGKYSGIQRNDAAQFCHWPSLASHGPRWLLRW